MLLASSKACIAKLGMISVLLLSIFLFFFNYLILFAVKLTWENTSLIV